MQWIDQTLGAANPPTTPLAGLWICIWPPREKLRSGSNSQKSDKNEPLEKTGSRSFPFNLFNDNCCKTIAFISINFRRIWMFKPDLDPQSCYLFLIKYSCAKSMKCFLGKEGPVAFSCARLAVRLCIPCQCWGLSQEGSKSPQPYLSRQRFEGGIRE